MLILYYDPVASTDAAARYLKELYTKFGDWNLAISA
ncbi:transglycosylase SLT domain-containing protein [Paenimyroides ceti]